MDDKTILNLVVALTDSIIKTQQTQMEIINLLSENLPNLSLEQREYLAGIAQRETERVNSQKAALEQLRRNQV